MQTKKNLLHQKFWKIVVEKFVAITLPLTESIILLKEAKCNFMEQNF